MPDWADELASPIWETSSAGTIKSNIAAALRKAKTDGERIGHVKGLREAADNVSDYVDAATLRLRFRAAADQIERGGDALANQPGAK